MTITALLAAGLVALAFLGPWLLRRAAPALVRSPRLAVSVIVSGSLAWLAALLTLGPMLAWASGGPSLLSGQAGAVCQRCLEASNPFSVVSVETFIPPFLLLVLPGAVAVILVAGLTLQMSQRAKRLREVAADQVLGARTEQIHGFTIQLVESDELIAFALPRRYGGIVLSSATVRCLETQEMIAVLAHERAHVSQHHHLVVRFMESINALLGWVPFIGACAAALPHYLEIAADAHAQRTAGTPALVGALVRLGQRPQAHMLHAAGPERIRQLVEPHSGRVGTAPASIIGISLIFLIAATTAVVLLYTSAAITGCA